VTLHSTELDSGLVANTGSSVTAAVQNNSAWKAAVNDEMKAWMKRKPDTGESKHFNKRRMRKADQWELTKSSRIWVSTYVTHTNVISSMPRDILGCISIEARLNARHVPPVNISLFSKVKLEVMTKISLEHFTEKQQQFV